MGPNWGSRSNWVQIVEVGQIGSKMGKKVGFGSNCESRLNWVKNRNAGQIGSKLGK